MLHGRRYWVAIFLSLILLLAVDVALSSFWTCYVPSEKVNCTAFRGPLLVAARPVLAKLDQYGDAIIAVFTVVLAFSTLALWQVTNKAANAAQRSADVAHKALIADQRPWVDLRAELAGPLMYGPEGWDAGLRWNLRLRYSLTNHGKTPAVDIEVQGAIIPYQLSVLKEGRPFPGTDIAKEVETICGALESWAASPMGLKLALFPREHKQLIFELNGNQRLFDEAKSHPGYSGNFLVIFCVAYRSTLEDTTYRTAKAFQLYKREAGGRVNLDGDTVSADKLKLSLTPNGNLVT